MVEDNIRVVHAFYEAYNAHDLDAMDRLRVVEFVSESTAGSLNVERVHRFDQSLITAFPDLHFDITLTVAEGDYVVLHWTATGTNNGVLRTPSRVAVQPTGRKVSLVGSQTFELNNSKIIRNWFFTDMASLLAQLGLMPRM